MESCYPSQNEEKANSTVVFDSVTAVNVNLEDTCLKQTCTKGSSRCTMFRFGPVWLSSGPATIGTQIVRSARRLY